MDIQKTAREIGIFETAVNLAKVKKKTGQTYLLENGEEIPISRKYRAETTDSFLYYSNFMMP